MFITSLTSTEREEDPFSLETRTTLSLPASEDLVSPNSELLEAQRKAMQFRDNNHEIAVQQNDISLEAIEKGEEPNSLRRERRGSESREG